MDTGEFIAIDVTEDELRRIANENRARAETLASTLEQVIRRLHINYHQPHTGLELDACNYTSCRKVLSVLAGEVALVA